MSITHPLSRPDIDVARLADEMSAALGKPVALNVAHSTGTAAGEVVVVDPATGEHMSVDPEIVRKVIDAHVFTVPTDQPLPIENLAAAVRQATTFAQLKAALEEYAGVEAEKSVRCRTVAREKAQR